MTPWIVFAAMVGGALLLDLGFAQRRPQARQVREAAAWMAVWVGLAVAYGVGVYFWFGAERTLEYATAYLIEEALSVDNMFVFYVLFSYFAVPARAQHRVLFWGIVGAMVMRAAFIAAGVALLSRFSWLIYVFGAFLVFTGIKLFFQDGGEVHPERNPMVNLFKRWVPLSPQYDEDRFSTVRGGRWMATPLMLVLVLVETTDLVFAVDSIPAVFAITRDPLIVYTSNIFAILGLRSLYFLLAGMIGSFRFLHYGLAIVLSFIGLKMLLSAVFHIPIVLSLGVVGGVIGISIGASLMIPTRKK